MNCPLCSSAHRDKWWEKPDTLVYWICRDCKLIWLDETFRPSRAAEEARYRTHQNHVTDPAYLAYLRQTAIPVAHMLRPGARGLDFGCGPTEGMKAALADYDCRVESYDPIFFPRPELLKNRYDFLICSEAAEHFFSPAAEFARIHSLLKQDGILAVSSRLSVPRSEFPQWSYRRDPTHVVFYQEETVHWLARRFGWKLLKLESPLWIFQVLSSGGRNLA